MTIEHFLQPVGADPARFVRMVKLQRERYLCPLVGLCSHPALSRIPFRAMEFRSWLALPLCLLMGAACGATDNTSDDDGEDGDDTPKETWVGPAGVYVTQVAIYQGPKRVLMLDGFPQQSNVPLVAGRDALVRVYYATDAGYNGAPVAGELKIDGFEPIVAEQPLVGTSNDADLASTVNFYVPGAWIGPQLSYQVGLLQKAKAGAADNAFAHWPQTLQNEIVPVDGPQNTLRLRMVPFQYNADGSGRLPDLSPEAVERFRQRFRALYPVSNVEVTVHDPEPWNDDIYPNGDGWFNVGLRVQSLRNQENSPDDIYYYGIFNPAGSLYQYCGGGCLLGVTLLNDQPPDVGDVSLLLAIRVGFEQVALDTATHEIGHAHGRPHADCGYGIDPQSIDDNFPYPNGGIGVQAYDITNGSLVEPGKFSDIMGYCETQFISDYNYVNLLNRGRNVNAALMHPPTQLVAYDLIGIDRGVAKWADSRGPGRPIAGAPVDVSVQDDNGAWRSASARYIRFDHLPGGWLFVPRASGVETKAKRAEFVLDGKLHVAQRQ